MQLYIITFLTIVIKEVNRFARIWVQTVLPSVVNMALYFIIFGNLIGSRIPSLDGFSYIQYIAPGIIMMAIINNSYNNVVSSFFGAKFQRSIEEMLVAPIPNIVILSGYIAGGVIRGVVVGIVVTLVSLLFTQLNVTYPLIVITVILLTTTLFSLAGFINGIFAKKFDDIAIIPAFVLAPLIYTGGVFYSISLLPEKWQLISELNPLLYIINAFRYGMLGVSDIDVQIALFIIIGFNIGLFSICLYLLNKGTGLKS